jgi:hypothetical protein
MADVRARESVAHYSVTRSTSLFWRADHYSISPLLQHPMSPEKPAKLKFPIWAFLNQPLFDPNFKVILHPQRFKQLYHLQFLERCLQKQSPKQINSPR